MLREMQNVSKEMRRARTSNAAIGKRSVYNETKITKKTMRHLDKARAADEIDMQHLVPNGSVSKLLRSAEV